MSSDDDAAPRRIMDQFGAASRIPYLDIEEGDVGVLLAFPIAGLFLASLTGIESLALPLIAAGAGLGAALIYVTPEHLNAWTWVTDIADYVRRPQITFNAPADADSTTDETTPNEGGLANYTPFTPDERTQDLTNIERAWPGAGAVQRADGTMEAFIRLDPGNMDFAMADDWAQLQAAGEAFANQELDAKLTFHATTRSFPVEQLTTTIEARLDDEDVESNPVFRELLEEYRETRPTEMRDRGIQQLQYYIGVEVSPIDVYDRYRDEATPIEQLTRLPVVGILFTPFVTRREDLTDAERRARMIDQLDDRVAAVHSEFVQQASGWSAHRLSTVELFLLNMAFWNGREAEYGDAEAVVRDRSVVGRSSREGDRDA